jgi:hypothetical protein
MAAPRKRPSPSAKGTSRQPASPPPARYGLGRIILTIALMMALGSMLGVLAAHLAH